MWSVAIRRLEQILVKKYKLYTQDNGYKLVDTDNNKKVAHLTYVYNTDLSILSLNVEPLYRRRGIATWLLLYTICSVVNKYPTLQYAVVDDMSDEGHRVGPNLYELVGFYYVDPPTEQFIKNGIVYWRIHGPERILDVEELNYNIFSIIYKLSKKVC